MVRTSFIMIIGLLIMIGLLVVVGAVILQIFFRKKQRRNRQLDKMIIQDLD